MGQENMMYQRCRLQASLKLKSLCNLFWGGGANHKNSNVSFIQQLGTEVVALCMLFHLMKVNDLILDSLLTIIV